MRTIRKVRRITMCDYAVEYIKHTRPLLHIIAATNNKYFKRLKRYSFGNKSSMDSGLFDRLENWYCLRFVEPFSLNDATSMA